MSEEKLLTISIAAYNIEKYIGKAISSCLSDETNNLIEILVIDDGSTDQTAKIASEYEKKFPDVVHVIKKQNGGYGSTINTAIPLAKGKYFRLLDGDDWFNMTGLQSLLSNIQRTDADLILTPYLSVSEKDGKEILNSDTVGLKSDKYPIDVFVDRWNVIRMHCATFKTQILKSMGLNFTEHCFYTDIEFIFAPLQSVQEVFVSHIPVYCYRVGRNEQSMSVPGIRKHFGDHGIILKYLFKIYDQLKNKETGNARIMYEMLKRECYGHYRYYCLLQINSKNKKHLVEYDKKLMNRKQLYDQLGRESKVVYYLRQTNFIAYPLACLLESLKKQF